MAAYERFAAFYDVVMDDPGPRADRVNATIERYRPDAASLLELGCGTGSILARLETGAQLTGLDRSPEMLAIASAKVPGARLVEGDMSSFDLGRRFDVVVCVFDSVNHLLDVGSWASTFACVHAHLAEGGLFVLDANTVGELARLGEEPPWVYDFDGGTAIIDITFALGPDGVASTDWDIRIFAPVTGTVTGTGAGAGYELHHERIGEIALPLERLRGLLSGWFDVCEEVDEDGLAATDTSIKAYYALLRRD